MEHKDQKDAEKPLPDVLRGVAAGLADPTNHYFLNANFYEHVAGDRMRWYLVALWLCEHTQRNFEVGADELLLDVLLDGRHLDRWSRIRIPYAEIWQVRHLTVPDDAAHILFDERANTLYYDRAGMRMPSVE